MAEAPTARWISGAVPVLLGFLPLALLGSWQGGYFPTAWGWASVPLLWGAALAAVLRTRASLSRVEVVFLGALTGLTGWIALSAAWSAAPALSLVETERALVGLDARVRFAGDRALEP